MRHIKNRGIAQLLAVVIGMSILMSACAHPYERPLKLPEEKVVYTEISPEYGNIPVKFYFDNTEGEYMIEKHDNVTPKFFEAMLSTPLMCTGSYALDATEDGYEFKNLKSDKEDVNRVIINAYQDDDFYITASTEKMRENFGILKDLYLKDNSVLDSNAVTVVFTDLTESDLVNTGIELSKKPEFENGSWRCCILAISLAMRTDKKQPFYIWDTSDSIIRVNKELIGNISERNYYLFMSGPAPSLSAYVKALKKGLEDRGLNDAGENMAMKPGEYNISNFDYLDFAYTNNKSLSVDENMIDNYSEKGDKEAFESYTIRLDRDDDIKENDTLHFVYNKEHEGSLEHKTGYNGSKTYDFSLNAALDINIRGMRTEYVDIDDDGYCVQDLDELMKKNNSEVSVENDIMDTTEESSQNSEKIVTDYSDEIEPCIFYTLGNIDCSYGYNGKWKNMDRKRCNRFFKELKTESGKLTIISDNTDEEGIDSVYICIPVYQVTKKNNVLPQWVESRSIDDDNKRNSVSYPYHKTCSFKFFYNELFRINIFGAETRPETTEVGHVKVLITGIGG